MFNSLLNSQPVSSVHSLPGFKTLLLFDQYCSYNNFGCDNLGDRCEYRVGRFISRQFGIGLEKRLVSLFGRRISITNF